MKRVVFLILCLGCVVSVRGQDTLIFTYQEFYEQILSHHPIVKQSNLIPESARRELLMARGGFDPKIEGSFDRKVYKKKEYFNRGDVYLKVPVWLGGADLKLGYDRNVGETLSDDVRTGPEGISYVGLTVPIGQGLLIDYRRATLRQARIFQEIADTERIKMINKIILTASKDYWNWYFAYRQYTLTEEFLDLAQVRYQAITQRTRLGESAAIDTVEALVTLQERIVQRQQADLDLTNARLLVSNHLWGVDQLPRELPDNAVPQASAGRIIQPGQLETLLEMARENHPEILKYTLKGRQLEMDRQLSREMLKPVLNVSASALYKGISLDGTESGTGISNLSGNYKFMVDLYFPVFLRKERGKIQQLRIKQMQNDLEQKQVQREVSTEINTAYNDVKTLENQIRVQASSVQNQELLVQAEVRKFELGESSLFLVNARESKLNEQRIKVESLRMKYEKALATLLFASGLDTWENL